MFLNLYPLYAVKEIERNLSGKKRSEGTKSEIVQRIKKIKIENEKLIDQEIDEEELSE